MYSATKMLKRKSTNNKFLKEKYFEKLDAVSARCRLCHNVYKHCGNTTNLVNHIIRKHPFEMDKVEDPLPKKIGLSQSVQPRTSSTIEESLIDDPDDENVPSTSTGIRKDPQTSRSRAAFRMHASDELILRSSTPTRNLCNNDTVSFCATESLKMKNASIAETFTKMKSYTDGGTMAGKITDGIVYMIAKDRQPLSIVEDKGFRKLMNIATPLYKMPCRKTITTRLDDKYHLLQNKVKTILSNVDDISLTSDIWTDPYNTKGFICITAHFINKDNMSLESINLGMQELEQKHDSGYISQILTDVCQEWGIEVPSVRAVVTDNAANIKKAVCDTFGSHKHLPCFAHTLNLMTRNALASTAGLAQVINKVKNIATFFKRSVNATAALRKLQKQEGKTDDKMLKLKQECETRWNSMYYMVERFLELANHVSTVLINYSFGRVEAPEMVSHSELRVIEDAIEVLSPIEIVTKEISGEYYVTCSNIIPIVNCLMKSLSRVITRTEISTCLLQNVLREINRRFYTEQSSIEKNRFLAISTLLDPRYKKLHFQSALAVSNAQSKVCQLMRELKPQDGNEENNNLIANNSDDRNTIKKKEDKLWNVHEELVMTSSSNSDESGGVPVELRQFLNSPVTDRRNCPLKIWGQLKDVYPYLYQIALAFFCVVGTSVPSERLFSKAGNIITEKQNRLKGKRASQLIFLGSLNDDCW